MQLRAWLIVLSALLGCSSADEGVGSGAGDAEGPRSDGGGGTETGDGTEAGTGTGTGTEVAAGNCEAETRSTSRCEVEGATCAIEERCCLCVRFEAAGCGMQWSCAQPANNADSCPTQAPALGGSCEAARNVCQYCTGDGPLFVRCALPSGSEQGEWIETTGLACDA